MAKPAVLSRGEAQVFTHTDEERAKNREYYRKNHEHLLNMRRKWFSKHRESTRKWDRELKLRVISHYSPEVKCVKCGFSDIRALSIDHIEGHGQEHRRKHKLKSGQIFYSWLIRNNFPDGFQVLCMNCQFIKRQENGEMNQNDKKVSI